MSNDTPNRPVAPLLAIRPPTDAELPPSVLPPALPAPPAAPPPAGGVLTGEVVARVQGLDERLGETAPGDGVVRLPQPARLETAQRQRFSAILQGIAEGGAPLGPLRLPPPAAPAAAPTRGKGKDRSPSPAPPVATTGEPAGPQASGGPASPEERQWPSGPLIGRDLFAPDEVRRLVEGILTDEEIMSHPTMPGLTWARLREAGHRAGFEPARFGRFIAALLVWFARAGVTVREDDKAHDWARPRPVVSGDRVEIRALLRSADPPDGDEVKDARAAGLGNTAV